MPRNIHRDDDQDAFSAPPQLGGDMLAEDDLFGMTMEPESTVVPPTQPSKAAVISPPAEPDTVTSPEAAADEAPVEKASRKPRKKKEATAESNEAPPTPVPAEEVTPVAAPLESVQVTLAPPPAAALNPVLSGIAPAKTPGPASPSSGGGPRTSAAPRSVQTPDGYVVVARRYRPQTFGELVGQEAVRNSLCGAIEQGRVGHAFLFSGPRGTGKTSTARILAKALNCMENGPRPDPCGRCASCLSISSGGSLDVIEIDAASNTGVDNIRDLRSGVALAPFSRYKVYIIDEVHMLSTGAFNALLKTLEEPPSQVVFVLATTEIHKVPETIVSRCQSFQFRRFSEDELTGQLGRILDTETARRQVTVDPDDRRRILDLLARSADGGMRDAQVLLDQILVLATDRLDYETVRRFVGAIDTGRLDGFVGMIHDRRTPELLEFIGELVDSGQDLETFTRSLVGECRNLLVLKAAPDTPGLVSGSPERLVECAALAARLPVAFLVDLSEQAVALTEALKTASNPRFLLELFVVRLSRVRPVDDLDRILKRLESLENGLPAVPRPSNQTTGGGPRAEAVRENPTEESAPLGSESLARASVSQRREPSVLVERAPAPKPLPQASVPMPSAADGDLGARVKGWAEVHCSMNLHSLEACRFAVDGERLLILVPRTNGYAVSQLQRMESKGQTHALAQALIGPGARGALQLVEELPISPDKPTSRPTVTEPRQPSAPMVDKGALESEPEEDIGFEGPTEDSMVDSLEAFYRDRTHILRGEDAMKVIRDHPELRELFEQMKAELPVDESGIELRVDGRALDSRAA